MLQQNNKYKIEKGENKQQGTMQSRYIQSNKMFDKDEQNDGQHGFDTRCSGGVLFGPNSKCQLRQQRVDMIIHLAGDVYNKRGRKISVCMQQSAVKITH